jgi:hypothetical protein
MNSHTSLDSRARHRVFTAVYEAAQPRRTEAELERARIQAHEAADRAMAGLDAWMHAAAIYVLNDGRRRGFPDALTEEAAQRVLAAIGQTALEATP